MIRLKSCVCKIAFTFTALLIAPLIASAQPLADRVPSDSMFYLGWRGTADLGPGYDKSELKALVNDTRLREFFADSMPRVVATLQNAAGADGKQAVDALRAIAPAVWKYPCAISLSVPFENNTAKLHLALLCKAGADAMNLQHTLDALIDQAGPSPVPIRTSVSDDLVVVAIGYDDPTQAFVNVDNTAIKPLSAKLEFANALAKCGGAPDSAVFAVYLDAQAVLALAEQGVARSKDQQFIEMWPKLRDGLGLTGLHRLMATSGFDGKMWSDRVFVDAPLPRTGIMGIFDAPPLSNDELKIVPPTATAFGATTFNLAKFITDARNTTAQISPDAGVKFDQGLSVVQMYVGRNLVRDILAPLGANWISYQDPNVAGPGFASVVLVNKLADPAKAAQGLNALVIAFNNTLNGFLHPHHVELTFRQTKIGDLDINYLGAPLIAPAWTIKDGLLYVGLYPQTVAEAASRGAGGKSILENPNYVATKALLGVEHPQSVTFLDLPQLAPQGYSGLLAAGRLFFGAADVVGGHVAEPVVPSLAVMMKHITPTGAASWSDEQGFYAKSVSPFPGAEVLANGGSDALIYILSGIGQMASTMAPAMSNARVEAKDVQSEANLRQIGMAVMMHANENKGRLPANLSGEVDKFLNGNHSVLHSPLSSVAASDDDYVYLGNENIKLSSIRDSAHTLLAYDNAMLQQGGKIASLFVDGHVELEDAASLTALIDAAKQKGLGGGL